MKKIILFLLTTVFLALSFSFAKPNLPYVPSDSVPYVIITTNQAKSAYQVLADWKTMKGTHTGVIEMSYILDYFPGYDNAEKVRNYIKHMHDNFYTRWVLLGGDVSEVPTRYARVWLGGSGDLNAISDYYYSCLEGDWNYDEDSLWGELEDSVDLNPQVYVGRIPTSNPDTVSYFINKLLSYEKNSPYLDYQTKALFLTSWINGDRSAQSLRDTLVTFLPYWFTQVNLDEYSSDEGIDSLNSGFGLIVNYSMSQHESNFITLWNNRDNINNDSLNNLNNQHRFGVMLNSTCQNNAFNLDCISKH
ncbi:MAG: C25 family cysteine peptidase, partial [Candidatus Zixiibacteriota bacterium]